MNVRAPSPEVSLFSRMARAFRRTSQAPTAGPDCEVQEPVHANSSRRPSGGSGLVAKTPRWRRGTRTGSMGLGVRHHFPAAAQTTSTDGGLAPPTALDRLAAREEAGEVNAGFQPESTKF